MAAEAEHQAESTAKILPPDEMNALKKVRFAWQWRSSPLLCTFVEPNRFRNLTMITAGQLSRNILTPNVTQVGCSSLLLSWLFSALRPAPRRCGRYRPLRASLFNKQELDSNQPASLSFRLSLSPLLRVRSSEFADTPGSLCVLYRRSKSGRLRLRSASASGVLSG
jgi:hypothetical protein